MKVWEDSMLAYDWLLLTMFGKIIRVFSEKELSYIEAEIKVNREFKKFAAAAL